MNTYITTINDYNDLIISTTLDPKENILPINTHETMVRVCLIEPSQDIIDMCERGLKIKVTGETEYIIHHASHIAIMIHPTKIEKYNT